MSAGQRNFAWMVVLWAAGVATASVAALVIKLLMLGAVHL